MKRYSRAFLIFFSVIAISGVDTHAKNKNGDSLQQLKGLVKTAGNRSVAQQLNKQGLAAHKKKDYKTAGMIWHNTAITDPSWVKPYFNLACANALDGKPGIAVEFVRLALEINPKKAMGWVLGDGDLVSIRKMKSFKEITGKYRSLSGKGGSIDLADGYHVLVSGKGGNNWIDFGRVYDGENVIREDMYAYSPGKSYLAYLRENAGGACLYIVSKWGGHKKITNEMDTGKTSISWSSDAARIVFNQYDGLYVYNVKSGRVKQILRNEPCCYACKARFINSRKIRFMYGTRFENSFSGSEHEVSTDGTGLREVPGGRVIKPEDMSGMEPGGRG